MSGLPRLLAGGRRPVLVALVANGIGQAAAAAATVLLVEAAFAHLARGGVELIELAPHAAGLAVAALATGALRARERVDAERLGQSVVHSLRMLMYDRLAGIPARELQRRSHGAVSLRFTGDLSALRQWYSLGLARLAVAGPFLAGALATLWFVNRNLGLAVTGVVAGGAAATLFVGPRLRARAREARRRRSHLAGNVSEKVAAIAAVQAFGQGNREGRRMRRQSERLAAAMVDRARAIGQLRGTTEGTAALAGVAVLAAGAAEVAAGRAETATVLAATAVVGLLVAPLRDLGRVQEYWHGSRVALEKIRELLSAPVLSVAPGARELEPGPGRLELREVSFGGAVRGVSAIAEPGELVVIQGPNGAGKSSLLAMAARLIEPERGSVLLDGQDLSSRTLESIREAISFVGPDLPLLRGSVERNVRYRRPKADAAELARVARLCRLDEVLASLPAGWRTRIVDGGRNLSAGQRQRLALARGLLGRPRVLMLDEADAYLDTEARELTDRVVRALRGEATVLMVSHRPEVAEWADRVWLMREGRLNELTASRVSAELEGRRAADGSLPLAVS